MPIHYWPRIPRMSRPIPKIYSYLGGCWLTLLVVGANEGARTASDTTSSAGDSRVNRMKSSRSPEAMKGCLCFPLLHRPTRYADLIAALLPRPRCLQRSGPSSIYHRGTPHSLYM